jgi:hypothetical protein
MTAVLLLQKWVAFGSHFQVPELLEYVVVTNYIMTTENLVENVSTYKSPSPVQWLQCNLSKKTCTMPTQQCLFLPNKKPDVAMELGNIVATQDRVIPYYAPNSSIKHSKSDSKDCSQEILWSVEQV